MKAYARYVDLVGASRLKEMILTARLLTADEALAAGFVHEIVARRRDRGPRRRAGADDRLACADHAVGHQGGGAQDPGSAPAARRRRPDRRDLRQRRLPRGRARLRRQAAAALDRTLAPPAAPVPTTDPQRFTTSPAADTMLASTALSHLNVIDLTRVRAGPTAVRQLADWGAQVIKVEMPPGMDEGEGIGGPRDDSDFQNVHRNKRGMTLNLKSQRRRGDPEADGRARRRAGRELPPRRQGPARHRLRDAVGGQPAAGLRQHLRLRRRRPVPPAPGLRPDRAGHGRADVDHRHSRAGAGARRHPDRRPVRRHLLRATASRWR